jgi:hypothetical protein
MPAFASMTGLHTRLTRRDQVMRRSVGADRCVRPFFLNLPELKGPTGASAPTAQIERLGKEPGPDTEHRQLKPFGIIRPQKIKSLWRGGNTGLLAITRG